MIRMLFSIVKKLIRFIPEPKLWIVSFDLLKGKVNVLIGENGAGKSTPMKMIAGIEQPSAGKMYMDGQEVYFKDTNAAVQKVSESSTRSFLFPEYDSLPEYFYGT
ncbi:MAG: ATP-binding cassette domain-containing protein [Blautia marasmi]